MFDNYLGGGTADLRAAPGLATTAELMEFPATLMTNSDLDLLRMSGEALADALVATGTPVEVVQRSGHGTATSIARRIRE